jgi:starvation-inducible DNA-binding protein
VTSTIAAQRLQQVLADLLELGMQAKQAHWNVAGPGFRSMHLALDELAGTASGATDTIAERLRAVGGRPDGRAASVAEQTLIAVV